MKKFFVAIILVLIIFELTEEKIYIAVEFQNSTEIIASVDAVKGTPLVINFIHSVQKTPVVEELEFDGDNFILRRTKYKSQGVGLPFMESDGKFYRDGDWFIMDEMNRTIKNLQLRTGTGTNLTVTLYEKFLAGTKIIISAERNFNLLLMWL